MARATGSKAFTTDAEQLTALRVPFPITEVKERKQGEQTLHYYEHNTIQNRLLDVFGAGLSLFTGETKLDEGNSVLHVEVILDVEWMSGKHSRISGWGSATVRKNGEPYKSAYSDAVKVAATKLGCGLELYDENYRESVKANAAAEKALAAEKELLTCQAKGCEIKAGKVGTMDLTAVQVATSTRAKFGQRLCIECANAAKAALGGVAAEPLASTAVGLSNGASE